LVSIYEANTLIKGVIIFFKEIYLNVKILPIYIDILGKVLIIKELGALNHQNCNLTLNGFSITPYHAFG